MVSLTRKDPQLKIRIFCSKYKPLDTFGQLNLSWEGSVRVRGKLGKWEKLSVAFPRPNVINQYKGSE